jgi:hypothetical protein
LKEDLDERKEGFQKALIHSLVIIKSCMNN